MDRQNLKDYITNHPDSKMAWYLLGRTYQEQGQLEKAVFCYEQSEEVYEAYESESLDVLRKQVERKRRTKTGTFWAKLGITVTLGLLLAFGFWSQVSEAPETDIAEPAESEPNAISDPPASAVVNGQGPTDLIIYVPEPERPSLSLTRAVGLLALPFDREGRTAFLMQIAKRNDLGWTDWNAPVRMIMSTNANSTPTNGTSAYQYLDPELCLCEPAEVSSDLLTLADEWKQNQEQLFVAKSAIYHYIRRNGELPEKLEQLAGDYPNNAISGVTPGMNVFFEQMKRELASREEAAATPVPLVPEQLQREVLARNDAGTLTPTPIMSTPLEIVVDTKAHKLALVSGKMIVRSYSIGLGGERTPEGTFEITEKVKNPNGRSDGDFGSRGMTLSDTLYAIHGTNEPDSIGKDESLGCVRMLNEDIEELFDMTPKGTKVTIGPGSLSEPSVSPSETFRLPAQANEENPGKRYRWL